LNHLPHVGEVKNDGSNLVIDRAVIHQFSRSGATSSSLVNADEREAVQRSVVRRASDGGLIYGATGLFQRQADGLTGLGAFARRLDARSCANDTASVTSSDRKAERRADV
jgi:hypothetical protein